MVLFNRNPVGEHAITVCNVTLGLRGSDVKTKLTYCAVATAICCYNLPYAMAQTNPSDADVSAGGLEIIEVTSQRRTENVQKTALAVSAVSTEQLSRSNITQPDQLSQLVPALQINKTGGSGNSFYIRGVGTQGTNSFAENAVAFNLDGVYIGRPASVVGTFYDLERLEVLKGPQGTLYGRNATGGAINVITRKPQIGYTDGYLTVGIGNYSSKLISGAVNLDVADNAALRISGQIVKHDGYLSDGYDDEDGKALRLQGYYQPTESTDILFSADYYHAGGKGPGSVLVAEGAPDKDKRIGGSDARSIAAFEASQPTAFFTSRPEFVSTYENYETFNFYSADEGVDYKGYQDSDFWGVSATINTSFEAGTLTVIPSYRVTKPDTTFYLPGFPVINQEDTNQTALEMRFTSRDEQSLRYVVGAYYFNEEQNASSWAEPFSFAAAAWGPAGEYVYADLSTDSQAVFGQVTYDLSESLRLTAGLRFTQEDKSMEVRQAGLTLDNYDLYDLNNVPDNIQAQGKRSFDNSSYRIGIEYDAAEESLLYANITTGFKSGGFFADVDENTFEPEEITSYVIGSKNRFLDNQLQLNAEIFYWDYTDQQISYLGYLPSGNFGSLTRNAGAATMQGLELDLQYIVFDDGLLKANIQYLDATYDEFVYDGAGADTTVTSCDTTASDDGVSLTVDCSGKTALNSPEWTLNLGYEHTLELDSGSYLVAAAWYHYETSRYVDIGYQDAQQQDAAGTLDLALTLDTSGGWSTTLYVNNVTDETVLSAAMSRPGSGAVYSALKAPRTFGIKATYRF